MLTVVMIVVMEGQAKVQWLYCVKSTVLTVVMIVVMEGQAKVGWL